MGGERRHDSGFQCAGADVPESHAYVAADRYVFRTAVDRHGAARPGDLRSVAVSVAQLFPELAFLSRHRLPTALVLAIRRR